MNTLMEAFSFMENVDNENLTIDYLSPVQYHTQNHFMEMISYKFFKSALYQKFTVYQESPVNKDKLTL